jgi:hypothetical protein
MALPAFCSPPQRNEGCTLYAGHREMTTKGKAFSFLDQVSLPKIYSQIKHKTRQLLDLEEKSHPGRWMFYDSGASRTVIQSDSPLRSLLTQVQPSTGSCIVGSGVKLPYVETGVLMNHNPVTVVDGLQFDLYSAVASAKRGISAVIDFDLTTGINKSFTYCKQTGEAFPLIERKQGVLELPMHLALTREDTTGLVIRDAKSQGSSIQFNSSSSHKEGIRSTPALAFAPRSMRPYHIAAFWSAFDSPDLSLAQRSDNSSHMALFTFDVVKSLSERERDFLIHARLAHLPSRQILN